MTTMSTPPADIIISILGAPASGKGTLCSRACSSATLPPMHHLSVGDLLRSLLSGPDIAGYVARGAVLPGSELVPLLREHISSLPASPDPESVGGKKIVLLDGFPRSLEQEGFAREGLVSAMGFEKAEREGMDGKRDGKGKAEFPDLVVYFDCPKEVLKERYVARRRGEDDGELFEKRYEQHEREGRPVIERYKAKGVLVEIDSGRRLDESYQEFVSVLERFLKGEE